MHGQAAHRPQHAVPQLQVPCPSLLLAGALPGSSPSLNAACHIHVHTHRQNRAHPASGFGQGVRKLGGIGDRGTRVLGPMQQVYGWEAVAPVLSLHPMHSPQFRAARKLIWPGPPLVLGWLHREPLWANTGGLMSLKGPGLPVQSLGMLLPGCLGKRASHRLAAQAAHHKRDRTRGSRMRGHALLPESCRPGNLNC